MEINGFEISEFNVFGLDTKASTSTCPLCSAERKNKTQKCLSVFWDTGIGQCNHCGERIQLHKYKKKSETKVYKLPERKGAILPPSETLIDYAIKIRGISKETLDALKITEGKRWMPKAEKEISVIEFPYKVFGELKNVKYRGKNKDFMFEPKCEVLMFNLDSIIHETTCVIVEGEWDCLAYVESGIKNVCSVPNGFTLPKKDGTSSINTSYIDDYVSFFESKDKIYIAVDNDVAGKHGQEELVRRFGSEKCWIVDFKDCKDANDYLLKYGKDALSKTLNDAALLPIEFVETLSDFEDELDEFWINGSPKGIVTGMKNLDDNYSTEFSQYTIITGPPQSGKSEFADSICIGYAMNYGIKTAFASPENKPNKFHGDKLVRKIAGYRPSTIEEVKSKRIRKAKEFCKEHFFHVGFNSGYELSRVLDKFRELVRRKGIKIFVIDPFNKTRLKTATNKSINEYTSDYLNEIDIFCAQNKVAVILVAHPVKMPHEEGTKTFKMPTAYDIKGGGEMFDMAYHILGVVKDVERRLVKVKTLKVKFQHLGTSEVEFYMGWNINNGRYVSVDFDPVIGTLPEISWDNGDWLANHEDEDLDEYPHLPEKTISVLDLVAINRQSNEPMNEDEIPF